MIKSCEETFDLSAREMFRVFDVSRLLSSWWKSIPIDK
jgi:hypothetical protein